MIRQAGMSLVELMVVVAIIGVLALVGIPFATAWMDEAAVNEGKSLLTRAHGQAKAVALRNPLGVVGDDAAAGFKLVDGELLLVCQGPVSNAECSSAGSRTVWQSAWPANVTSSVLQAEMNNRGQIVVGGSAVNTDVTYTISKGSVSDDSDYNVLR